MVPKNFSLLFLHFVPAGAIWLPPGLDVSDDRLYGLDHAILNFKLPPYNGMWMNMGYWEHETDFPGACEALLNQVLQAAGLIQLDGHGRGAALISNPHESPRSIRLVDVGFGCGDQTIYLTTGLYWINAGTELTRPLFNSYLGITIVGSQADFARQRVSEHWMSTSSAYRTPDVQLFCADAANPSTWSPELKEAILANRTSSCTWLLALDTLYHFKPSRQPLFDDAFSNLHSSIMAFDLILSDSASLIDRLLLKIVCLMSSTPFSNFVTKAEYEKMLVDAGYSRQDITFRDISEHVFPGIAAYMQRRDKELKNFGLGLGKFKAAGRVFDWWARSGVVRGIIVVAKRPGEL
ncbi:hypothetical protein VTN00DRAFT_7250 [Thermoascus crustaceus]|uniref:uncharacterized protein n=1 Tax=Thermoascus crustaceus TaxID=5088 RepID=UPI00374373AB